MRRAGAACCRQMGHASCRCGTLLFIDRSHAGTEPRVCLQTGEADVKEIDMAISISKVGREGLCE